MKKLFLAFTIMAAMSATAQNTRPATVTESSGIYCFVDNIPADQYEFLGEVKIYVLWSSKPKAVKRALIKKAKKKYPNASGIIWKIEEYSAEVIKFK